jgi:hypothetical protein
MVDSSDVNQEYPGSTSPFLGIHALTALVHPCTSPFLGIHAPTALVLPCTSRLCESHISYNQEWLYYPDYLLIDYCAQNLTAVPDHAV